MPTMRHPTRNMTTVNLGGHEYKGNHDGLFEVHPGHVPAMRAFGFKMASEIAAEPAVEVAAPAADEAPAKAPEAREPDDEFKGMNMEALAAWLAEHGMKAEDVAGLKSKAARRDAARKIAAAPPADAEADPLS